MAPVYREVVLAWGGKEYTVTPTYELIQKIEQKVSLSDTINRLGVGRPPISHMAWVVATMLNHAGCKSATPEQVYEVLAADLYEDGGEHVFVEISTGLLEAFLPQRKSKRGNEDAPAPEAGAQRKIERSTGRSTTPSPSDGSGSSPPSSGG